MGARAPAGPRAAGARVWRGQWPGRARPAAAEAGAAADGEARAPVPSRAQRGLFPAGGRMFAQVCGRSAAGQGRGPGSSLRAAREGREGSARPGTAYQRSRWPSPTRFLPRHPVPGESSWLWAACPSMGSACHQDVSPPPTTGKLPAWAESSAQTCRGLPRPGLRGTGLEWGLPQPRSWVSISLPSLSHLALGSFQKKR